MKKKLIFLSITTLCVLLVACVAFAACDPKHRSESGFKVTLDFNSEQGDVTLSKPAEGELYDAGEKVTVTVTPKTGWSVNAFTVSGYDDATLNGGGYTFDIQADTTVTVTFKKVGFSVTTTVTPSDGGVAELSPIKEVYEYGDAVTVEVKPSIGYELDKFVLDGEEKTENLSSTSTYSFTVSKDTAIAVSFKKIIVELQIFDSQNGAFSPASPLNTFKGGGFTSYEYEYGTDVTVTVDPEAGYELDKVTGVGDITDTPDLTDNAFTFKITQATSLTPTFKKSHYALNLTVTPAENGSASITPQKEYYEYGDEVTLKVSASSDITNYPEIVARVAGKVVELDENGECKFTVYGATDIRVTYVSQKAIDILASLKGSIVFEGTRLEKDYFYYPDYPNETVSDLKTTFDAAKNAVLMEAYEGSEPMRFWLFQGDKNNNIVQITHDQNGSVQRQPYDNIEGVTFADLFNPFDILNADLLQNVEGNKWTIENAAARYNIANALLGYADISMEYFEMYEENGKITKIKFAFDRVTAAGYEDYQYSYDIDVKEHGTASIDDEYFNDYPMTEAHDELKAAMESAAEATSYSVTYDNGYYNYTLYYTPDGIYYEMDGEGNGYVLRPDGKVWRYFCEPEGDYFEFDEATAYTAISELKAPFVFRDDQGEYYNLLKDMGEGKFAIRPADVYDSYGSITSFFKLQLATGEEQIDEFSSAAYVFAITIKDGKPFQMDFEVYGEPATLTFGDWNSATLPYQVPADVLNGKIEKAYSGSWASENGDTVLSISLDKILFDGEKVDALTSLSGGGYSFTYDEKSYTLVKNGNDLTLTQGSISTTLYNCPWAMYIGDFYQNNADVTIRANSIKVKFKGTEEQSASDIVFESVYVYDEYSYPTLAYQFSFKLGNDNYVMQQVGYDYNKLVIAKEGEESGLGLYRDYYEEFESWEDYLGTYIGEGYTAKLESDKLTITFDGKSEQATELIFYRDWDYDYTNNYYYQFAFKYDGKDCVLEIVDENTMLLVIDAKSPDAKQVYLTDETYKPDYTQFYGIYEAYTFDEEYNISGVTCHIEIGADRITVKIEDEKTQNASVLQVSFEDSYAGTGVHFTFKLEDETICYVTLWPQYGTSGYSGFLTVGEQSYNIYPVTDEAE